MLKANTILEIDIQELNSFGSGIARHEGQVLEIPKAYPGEKVKIRLLKTVPHSQTWICNLEEVLKASPDRLESDANWLKDNGAPLELLKYPAQLKYKNSRLKTYSPDYLEVVPAPEIDFYRNQSKFVLFEQNKKPSFGVLLRRQEIQLKESKVEPLFFLKFMDFFTKKIAEHQLSVYQTASAKGFLRGVSLKYSKSEETLQLTLLANPQEKVDFNPFLDDLQAGFPALRSIYMNTDKTKLLNLANSKKNYRHLKGDFFLIEQMPDSVLKFKLTPTSLLYPNLTQSAQLFSFLIDQAQLTGKEKILDLYCGSGLSSLYFAQHSRMVYGVDSDKNVIRDAVSNARINRLENTIYLEDQNPSSLDVLNDEKLDILVVKAPSKLMGEDIFKLIRKHDFKKLFLISSFPEDILKDIQKLKALGYTLRVLKPFDMLPHTFHLEVVAVLDKKLKIKLKK